MIWGFGRRSRHQHLRVLGAPRLLSHLRPPRGPTTAAPYLHVAAICPSVENDIAIYRPLNLVVRRLAAGVVLAIFIQVRVGFPLRRAREAWRASVAARRAGWKGSFPAGSRLWPPSSTA